MSACKRELVAIYRLEFYKKQKNWKLSNSSRKKNSKKQQKQVEKKPDLNTTYNLENVSEKEDPDPLNTAFHETEPDSRTQASLPQHCSLSHEWQAPVNIWPRNDDSKTEKPTSAGKCCEQFNMYPEVVSCTDWDTSDWENRPVQPPQPPSAGHLGREFWTTDAAAEPAISQAAADATGFARAEAPGSEPWQTADDVTASPPHLDDAEEWCEVSAVDSLGEFMRGADVAPHSSETDLTLPPLDLENLSFTHLSRLSTQQLLHATGLHARALSMLQLEVEHRQRLRDQAWLDLAGGSLDSLPTRDPGPDPFAERVLAGSHVARGEGDPRGVWGPHAAPWGEGGPHAAPWEVVGPLTTWELEGLRVRALYPAWSDGESQPRGRGRGWRLQRLTN